MSSSSHTGASLPTGREHVDTSAPTPVVQSMIEGLNSRIIGQPRAVDQIARSLEIDAAGLLKPGALAMRQFCAGPPGVGKTQLAYELARFWIGNRLRDADGHLLQPISLIDCTQYADSHDIANLKGSTKGYVGYEDETPLTQRLIDHYAMEILLAEESDIYLAEKVRRNPDMKTPRLTPKEREKIIANQILPQKPFKKVLLFDEVGRAHRNLWNILITIMNAKPFEFGDGSKADFSRGALLMSDNTNEKEIQELMKGGIGFHGDWREADPDKLQDMLYKQTLKRIEDVFPPAFVSRVRKHIVVFGPLSGEAWNKILELRLSEIAELFELRTGNRLGKVPIVYTDECRAFLLEKGIDRIYGARPLEQELEKHVVTRLAKVLNRNAVRAGDRLVFDRERKPKDRIEVYVER